MIKTYRHIAWSLLIFSLWLVMGVGRVQAQVTPTTATSPMTDVKTTQLKTLFRQQLEQYQVSEREYSLYKQQYKQLQTLASLEKAVQAARMALVRRSEVLTTYFDLIFAQLTVAQGIDEPVRQTLSQDVTDIVTQLRQQTSRAQAITDKQGVASFSDEFELFKPEILKTSYKARAYIQVGAYRDLSVRATRFTAEIKSGQATDSASAFKQTARLRAYQETEAQSRVVMESLNITLDKLAANANYSESWYITLQERLVELQSGLEKLYAFIAELTNY